MFNYRDGEFRESWTDPLYHAPTDEFVDTLLLDDDLKPLRELEWFEEMTRFADAQLAEEEKMRLGVADENGDA